MFIHDMASMIEAFESIDHDRPVVAHQPLHQPQPAPVILVDLDLGPARQEVLQLGDDP